MRNIVRKGLLSLLLLVGLGILFYPKISNYINRLHSSSAVQSLTQQLQNTSREELERQLALAKGYNESLLKSETFSTEYEDILDFGDGIMGYIRIPAIAVELPVYHGVGSDVLSKGVGHMSQSAFPVGGTGNHSVLTGHTGLPSAELFTDLTKMQIGDLFYITVAGIELVYRVDQISTVTPTDNGELVPVAGEDYCTLVTCTPYGINSHRLLVRGHRVEGEEHEKTNAGLPNDAARGMPVCGKCTGGMQDRNPYGGDAGRGGAGLRRCAGAVLHRG